MLFRLKHPTGTCQSWWKLSKCFISAKLELLVWWIWHTCMALWWEKWQRWRIAAFNEMLLFDKIIFIIFSRLVLKRGRVQGTALQGMSKARLIKKHFMFSSCLSLKSSRFWATCSSKTACHPPFPHQQPSSAILPTCPTGRPPFLPARKLSLRLVVWQVSPQFLLRTHSRSAFLRGEFRESLQWQTGAQEELTPGRGEGMRSLNSFFSAGTIERHGGEFEWGATERAGTQVPWGMGAEYAVPGWNPWGSSCKGKSKPSTPGYSSVHPGRGGQVMELKGRQA